MSIASRITAIEEHIRDIYDTIDYSYDTTGVDKNIINIPQNIFNGYINVLNGNGQSLWNALEKVSQADVTEAELSNVVTAPMKMVLNGNTSQDGEPTPDTPVEVKVVKGNNVVSVSGKNLLDTSNARNDKTWLTRNSDGSLTLNYPSGSNVNFTDLFENNINIPTDNYILKIFMEGTFVGGNLIVKNTNGNYIGQTPIRNGNAITITNSDIGNIQFYVVSAGTNCTIKLELEKGTPTSYVPYSKTDYPINLNANMFDPTQIPEGNFEKRLSTTGGLYGDIDYFVSDWIPIQPNTEYEVNWTPEAKKRICFYSSFLVSSFISSNDTENIFKTPNNATYMRFSNLTSEISNLSVKLKNSLELCKINTYQDYFHKDSGKWYVHKEIGKKIFDGSENWKTNRENDNYMRFHARALSNVKVQNTGYSNLFIVQSESSSKNTLSVYPGNDFNVYIWLSKSIADSVANFKTWLSTHNTIVYYVLATPTETEITNTTLIEQLEAISKAKSVKDKTYITQTNEELPFILDVEAIKEYSVE